MHESENTTHKKVFPRTFLARDLPRSNISKRQLNGPILWNSNVRIFFDAIAMSANLLPRQLALNLPSLFTFSTVLFYSWAKARTYNVGIGQPPVVETPLRGKRRRRKWEGGQSLPPSLRRSKSSNSGPRSRAPFSSPYF